MKVRNKFLLIILCFLLLTQTFMISNQEVNAVKKDDQEIERLLKEKVNFVNPIDAFTLYSFMNYTGYDQENHTKFHTVRESVREDLKNMDINISEPNYFKDFDSGSYTMLEADMSTFIGWLGSPPNFTIDPKMEEALGAYVHRDLSNLDERLTEFYKEAEIEKLYKKYKPSYDDVIEKNKDEVYQALIKTVKDFNLDIREMRDFDIFVNLLDMNWRGYMFDRVNIDPNTKKAYLLQIGPTPNNDINIHNIVHEFSHIFEVPIIRDKPEEFKKLNLALTYEYGNSSNQDYPTWDKIVDESIVRAMTIWVMDGNRNDIMNEMSQGFIMTEYIYDRIDDFDKNPDLKFEDWILSIMNDYAEKIHDFGDLNNGDYDAGYETGYEDGYAEGYIEGENKNINNKDHYGWIKLPSVKDISLDKKWSINFNRSFDVNEIASISIVRDNTFIASEIILEPENSRIIVNPINPYKKNTPYSLKIVLNNGNKYIMDFITSN